MIDRLIKEDKIEKNSLFTFINLHDQEGILFFKPVVKKDDSETVTDTFIDPYHVLIDSDDFEFSDDLEQSIKVYSRDGFISFHTLNGKNLKLDENEVKNSFPFEIKKITNKPPSKEKEVDNHIKIKD